MTASHDPGPWNHLDELEAVADEMFLAQEQAHVRLAAHDYDSLGEFEQLLETAFGGFDDAEPLDIAAEQLATEE